MKGSKEALSAENHGFGRRGVQPASYNDSAVEIRPSGSY